MNAFSQRLILYETPLFHQYLFEIANCWLVCSYKRQNPLVSLFLLCESRWFGSKVEATFLLMLLGSREFSGVI